MKAWNLSLIKFSIFFFSERWKLSIEEYLKFHYFYIFSISEAEKSLSDLLSLSRNNFFLLPLLFLKTFHRLLYFIDSFFLSISYWHLNLFLFSSSCEEELNWGHTWQTCQFLLFPFLLFIRNNKKKSRWCIEKCQKEFYIFYLFFSLLNLPWVKMLIVSLCM